jgi:diacylglycerol kinase
MNSQPRPDAPSAAPPRRRTWWAKFHDAFRGIKLGVRGHSSFFVHFFLAIVVLAAAALLELGLVEWCLLIGSITAVIAAELINSAIEILCRVLDLERLPNGKAPLDIASGAVLSVAIGAAVIGTIIFAARLLELLN